MHHSFKRPGVAGFVLVILSGIGVMLSVGSMAARAQADEAGASQPSEIRVAPAKPGDAVSAEFRLGSSSPATISLLWTGGKPKTIRVVPGEQKLDAKLAEKTGQKSLPDSTLNFQGMGIVYYIRPRLMRYTSKQQEELIPSWLAMPGAREKFIRFAVVPAGDGVSLYLDDRYAGHIEKVALKEITFTMPAGGSVRNQRSYEQPSFGPYVPLNFGAAAQPGAMKDAKVSIATGLSTVGQVPMIVADGAHSGDMSKVKQMKGSWALECDEYLSRTTFDGMPESQMLTVPQAYYRRAWVLFAVDPDPKKDSVMTVRLTRFAGGSEVGRGGPIADVTVQLPREGQALPEGMSRVGSVQETIGGKAVELPLYLAKVDIPTGQIIDLISSDEQDRAAELKIGPYLDFEILGRCGQMTVSYDYRHKPTGDPSAANIFGVTLERAPAEFRLTQSQPGNIFYNEEVPQTTAVVKAVQAGQYTLSWDIADVHGKALDHQSKRVTLEAGQEASVPVSLARPEVGWYGLKFTLSDPAGTPMLVHDASFALLGQDTREAGYESPYGVWWFSGAHLTTSDIKIAGALQLKAGLRRTSSAKYSEAEMAPWKMTLASLSYPFRGLTVENFDTVAAKVEKELKEKIERYPHCTNVLIFHEGLSNAWPTELAGVEPTFTDKQRESAENRAKLANMMGEFYRARFPNLKVIVGNNSGTAKVMADLFRFGFNPKNADYMGMEPPSQTIMPEVVTMDGIMATWITREISRYYKHEMPVTGTYEFTYRRDQAIGPEKQAQYYVRDILISHAYGFDHISPGALDDAGGSYYNTVYGDIGIVERMPHFYPKPAYVAIATATRVLDKVKLSRVLDTGSRTVYALEMKRNRSTPDYAYPMWAPRGVAELTYDFGKDLTVQFVDFYGRQTTLKTTGGKIAVTTSPEATYLISPEPVKRLAITRRSFPNGQPPEGFKPANAMDSADQWQVAADEPLTSDWNKPGQFELRQVKDAEKGQCLELELHKAKDLPDLVSEYTAVKLKRPVALAGKPHTIGLWVKGNSNWGRIYFQVMDANGKLWRCSGGKHSDWPADLAVNFDGWRFVSFFIDAARSPVRNMSPGAQWVPMDPQADGAWKPAYPLKLVGIDVQMFHKAVDPVEMRDVPPVLRFRDIGAYE